MKISSLKTNELFYAGTYCSLPAYERWSELESTLCIYCRKGRMEMDIDSRKCILEARSLVFCVPGSLVRFRKGSRDMEIVLMILPDELLADCRIPYPACLMLFFKHNPCLVFQKRQTAGIETALQGIERIYGEREHHFRLPIARLHVQNLFLEIYDKVERTGLSDFSCKTGHEENLCARFILLVQKNHMLRYTLAFYACTLHVSQRYFSRVVKTVTGMTPGNIINHYMAERSKTLLKHTDIPVHEISTALRFRDRSVFSRFFRRETGMSPEMYRQAHFPISSGTQVR